MGTLVTLLLRQTDVRARTTGRERLIRGQIYKKGAPEGAL